MNKGISGGMGWSVSELRDAGGDHVLLERYQTEYNPKGQFVDNDRGLDRAFSRHRSPRKAYNNGLMTRRFGFSRFVSVRRSLSQH